MQRVERYPVKQHHDYELCCPGNVEPEAQRLRPDYLPAVLGAYHSVVLPRWNVALNVSKEFYFEALRMDWGTNQYCSRSAADPKGWKTVYDV